ncbi:MAG TPA: hypothetical protein VFM88_15755 [Vicinamibacteria bacterium]|nr:hypothetical protein [Vicinamibacteria bacterium]
MIHWFLALLTGHVAVAVIAALIIGRFFAISEIDEEAATDPQSSAA